MNVITLCSQSLASFISTFLDFSTCVNNVHFIGEPSTAVWNITHLMAPDQRLKKVAHCKAENLQLTSS